MVVAVGSEGLEVGVRRRRDGGFDGQSRGYLGVDDGGGAVDEVGDGAGQLSGQLGLGREAETELTSAAPAWGGTPYT